MSWTYPLVRFKWFPTQLLLSGVEGVGGGGWVFCIAHLASSDASWELNLRFLPQQAHTRVRAYHSLTHVLLKQCTSHAPEEPPARL